MFQPGLYRRDDEAVRVAETRAGDVLREGAKALAKGSTVEHATIAAWSIAHGFAGLWIGGALRVPAGKKKDAVDVARPVLRTLLKGL